MLGAYPTIDGVLDIKESTGMGTTTDTTEWNPQRVGNRVGEPTIRTGGDVQQVETAIVGILILESSVIS